MGTPYPFVVDYPQLCSRMLGFYSLPPLASLTIQENLGFHQFMLEHAWMAQAFHGTSPIMSAGGRTGQFWGPMSDLAQAT